ncbi:DNA primase [Clostridium formicaceticum]|uniref:DNA primase n=1 Tax=Clostridium formicaceticum TaxID=1497 RepID=A0AAC9WGQ6_9CLOT|nr:DNA primase [Clostridium formicaceticum]AOY77525.1 DNA primase [Clostridium formicaceticum]ARE88096.1 DNA primase [Clostridium formicaceticum]
MENYFPEELIIEIKEKNDIVEVISQYIQLRSTGSSYKALCPFHNEKTPSFHVNTEKQWFKCFGCGEGGDVIGFVMKIENLDFVEAVKILAQRANIYIDELAHPNEIKERQKNDRIYYDINRQAGRYFYDNLVQRRNLAQDYLIKRGLTIKAIRSFGLGYALDGWDYLLNHLVKKGYSKEDIEKSGLIVKNKQKDGYYDRFRKRIMFPIFDVRGNVIAFGGRVLDDALPKYLNSPETKHFNKSEVLYGLHIARKNAMNGQGILVEGYMDVIALHQQGFKNAIATLGTSLTQGHALMLKKYFNEIIICFDGDTAGIKATLRSIEILQNVHIDIKVLTLPDNVDPDDFIKKKGKDAFEKKLKGALNFIDYKIYIAQQEYASKSLEDQIKLGKAVANILKQIKSPIEQETYIKNVEEKFGISKDAIIAEMYGRKTSVNITNNTKYSSNHKRNNKYIESLPLVEQKGYIIAEKQLLKFMLTNPELISSILQKIDLDDFILESHRDIFQYIINNFHNKENLDNIKEKLPNLQKEVKSILDIDIQQMDMNKSIEKYKTKIKRSKLLYQRNKLKEQQNIIMSEENPNKEEVEKQLLKLGVEMMKINIELQKLQSEERREQH